jgi:hypothetical protein
MNNLHFGHCLVGLALAAVVLIALGVSGGTLVVLGAALACPLMMIVMVRSMMGGQAEHTDQERRDTSGQR